MNMYSTPSILKETLNDGHKIRNVFYEMNPLREPIKRIGYYRINFRNDSFVMNKTQKFFRKNKESPKTKPKLKKIKKAKTAKSTAKKNKLYNSYYSKFFFRINYDRPREIRNELGVIISRHFKSLDINSREYPENIIRAYYFNNNPTPLKKYILNNKLSGNNDCGHSNFFRTEIKLPNNKNNKNIDADIERLKKYNPINNLNNIINKNAISQNGTKIYSYENYSSNSNSNNTNYINSKKFMNKDKSNYQGVPPLLVSNKNSINSSKKLNDNIDKEKRKYVFQYEEEKSLKKFDNNIM